MSVLPEETWRRNEWAVAAAVFSVFTGFAFVLPFLPLFVKQLGVADDRDAALWAGVLIGVAPLLAGLLAPVWGALAERHGHKRMAVRALASYVVLLLLTALVQDVWQLLLLRAGIGLFGGVGPLGLAMATALAPPEHTGRAVGTIQSAQILSAAIGPFAGGYLAETVGIRPTFVVTAALSALSLALILAFYVDAPVRPRSAQRGLGLRAVLLLPSLPALLLVTFLVNFVGRSFTPVLPLHLGALGVERVAFATGLLVSAYAVAAAVSASGLGAAAARFEARRLLAVSLLGGALAVAPMAWAGSYGALLACAVGVGLFSGGALTLCYTVGGRLVPEHVRTTALGFLSGAALFGGALSPSVAGALTGWDLRAIYAVDAVVLLVLGLAVAAVPMEARSTGAA